MQRMLVCLSTFLTASKFAKVKFFILATVTGKLQIHFHYDHMAFINYYQKVFCFIRSDRIANSLLALLTSKDHMVD